MRLIILALGWVLGISLARHAPSLSPAFWIIAAAAAGIVAAAMRGHQRRWRYFALLALALGGLRQATIPQTSDIARHNGISATVTGVVSGEPIFHRERIQLRVESEAIFVDSQLLPTSGLVLIEADNSGPAAYGDKIRATGLLETPATWDTFSYADYLARQNIFSLMRGAGLEVVDSGLGSSFYALLLQFKQSVHHSLNSALPEPQAGLLAGILLGNEQGISAELEDDFRRVGATHIIAISGFNMVLISAIVIRVFRAIAGGSQSLATIAAILFILAYSILVGASGGILRAALMSSLLVIGQNLRRSTFVPTQLAFAVLLLSFFNPHVLLDISFQLSFFAVLGLGLFVDPLSRRLRQRLDRHFSPRTAHWLHAFLNEPLIVSVSAQIATLPLAILYFGRLSLVSLPVNMLIVPVQSLILPLALLAAFTSFLLPAIGALLFWAAMIFLSWSIAVVRAFAQIEHADLIVNVDDRLIQLYYLLMIGGAILAAARTPTWTRLASVIRQRRITMTVASAAAIVLTLMTAMLLSRSDGRLHIWLLNMGHSNALFMQTPGGSQILVDGGRFPARLLTAIGDRMPFHDREIELLVITHPDEWDISAINSVIERYDIGLALYSGQPNQTDAFQNIMRRLAESNTDIAIVSAGHAITLEDDLTIEVLHPQSLPRITDPLTDHVLVLRLRYQDLSLLLTSDLSPAGQAQMLRSGISPQASIFQIPQHGTIRALDESFLAAVNPQIALLQVDPANRRGDPDPDTMNLLNALIEQGRLFRTDQHGTIHISTDGRRALVHSANRQS